MAMVEQSRGGLLTEFLAPILLLTFLVQWGSRCLRFIY